MRRNFGCSERESEHKDREIMKLRVINGIDFEEVKVNLAKGEHRRPEFKDINPMKQVPAVVDGKLKLFESHAILRYLSCAYPGIPDHWYPADLSKRAKIDSVLDWHHSNLRRGAAGLVFNSVLAPALGYPLNLEAAADAEKILIYSLSKIESVWLHGNEKFLVDGLQPSIADLSLVCEIMQLEVLGLSERDRILGSFTKVQKWIENVKHSTYPHFEEVHALLYRAAEKFQGKEAVEPLHGLESKRKEYLKPKL
ncbi:glutathione S-transferase T1 isoform X2 [Nymphaea colorata]|uniref:glutathione S-transferase T1 isoform X2 n=1 Tax=Nymphaea colorata TaxID=210225 RepID=UPI00214E5ED5|nr:glutathione S-transferase T1 isoform X2 [Nymphaea colorata]